MAGRRDSVRQVIVVASAILAIAAAFVGSGAAGGTPIDEAAGGALSTDATPVAPGSPAFAIWSVIYAGLVAYAVWQLLPSQRADARQRRLGYLVAASLVLNAAWILSIQFDLLPLSVPVIVLLLVVLALAFRITLATRPRGLVEATVVDGTIGLYLGWVCVATVANIAAVLAAAGFAGFGIDPDIWAVTVIAFAGLVGVLLALYGNGRIAPALSLGWGLGWIAVARLTGDPPSAAAALAASVSILAILTVTAILRIRAGEEPARVSA